MSELKELADAFDGKLQDFEHRQESRDKTIYDKIDKLVEHDHKQDLEIQKNEIAIGEADEKIDREVGYLKESVKKKVALCLKILLWICGPTGLIGVLFFLLREKLK